MATHDYVIDNQTAPNFRADLNNALQAIVSNNSGSTEPPVTYANMMWYDTANNLLRMRNEADDAFITLGTLDQVAGTFAAAVALASQAEAEAGTDNTKLMTPLRVAQQVGVPNAAPVKLAINATGTAPIFACRAWVNFNGTGVVAIRASGNVSSITDNGTGNYTVNFTTAMGDANYCLVVSGATTATNNVDRHAIPNNSGYSTTSCVVRSGSSGSNTLSDFTFMHVAIFR